MFPVVSVEIKRRAEGYTDDSGNWVPAGEHVIATADADIQPLGGFERNTFLQTTYESTHRAFINANDIHYEDGYSSIEQGDVLVDADGTEYTVTFVASWILHIELDLRENNGD